jgi:hypothetical protein
MRCLIDFATNPLFNVFPSCSLLLQQVAGAVQTIQVLIPNDRVMNLLPSARNFMLLYFFVTPSRFNWFRVLPPFLRLPLRTLFTLLLFALLVHLHARFVYMQELINLRALFNLACFTPNFSSSHAIQRLHPPADNKDSRGAIRLFHPSIQFTNRTGEDLGWVAFF